MSLPPDATAVLVSLHSKLVPCASFRLATVLLLILVLLLLLLVYLILNVQVTLETRTVREHNCVSY